MTRYSIVVPVFHEAENIGPFCRGSQLSSQCETTTVNGRSGADSVTSPAPRAPSSSAAGIVRSTIWSPSARSSASS